MTSKSFLCVPLRRYSVHADCIRIVFLGLSATVFFTLQNLIDNGAPGKKIQKYSLAFKKEVIAYAEARGNRPASKRFSIDEKRVREWRAKKSNIEGLLGSTKGKQRSRLSGGGRKPLSAKLEELLLEWIEKGRARGLRVSCKLIMKKAEATYHDMTENNLVDNDDFKASRGWLENFMKRNRLSLRRKTYVPQEDPERMVAKLKSCVIQVRRLQEKHKYKPSDISAMDETPVWCDVLSETTVDATGKKSITLKSTGHEKARVSVCLAAKADGTKLKPMVVFKGAKREVPALKQKFQHRVVVAWSANGWMDTELTKIWVDSVLGSFSFNQRLFAWDSYECDMEDSITDSLKSEKIDRVILPGGCAKYIQDYSAGISPLSPRAQRSTINGRKQLELMKKLPLEI
ncbi:Pogo transposable element with KRAB domain [Stylophora pistillata]|uniref:Pogo transposable element with KRAB domain n=1 Tax=Stylophora pistillata TaxID=50429 RepID=A0A2B4RBE5_STYPI|nr:Pogo transposable element with KRAB domain [Stylophora pistillata]